MFGNNGANPTVNRLGSYGEIPKGSNRVTTILRDHNNKSFFVSLLKRLLVSLTINLIIVSILYFAITKDWRRSHSYETGWKSEATSGKLKNPISIEQAPGR
jgi:hypothetical protein